MGNKRIQKTILLTTGFMALLLIGAFSFRLYNGHRFHVEKQTRFMMDTVVTIIVVAPPEKGADAIRAAFDSMQVVDEKFNTQNPNGAVYAFNHYDTPIADPEIITVVSQALAIAQLSGGAFDITIEPLIELWGFYTDKPALPEASAIEACLRSIGYQHLHIKEGVLTKDLKETRIDLGGIAKGYAVGQAAAALKAHGIESAMINAGGDVYALGRRGKDLWKIGIRNPRGEDLVGFLEVEDMAVMGSGDYQRFFIKDGKRYHHIFDPKTGYPAQGIMSSTLLHRDPMISDALNTAIFVMGAEKGLALIEKIPDTEAMMITSTNQRLYTSGLSHALNINSNAKILGQGGSNE